MKPKIYLCLVSSPDPTYLVLCTFWPPIPTSHFNYIVFLYLFGASLSKPRIYEGQEAVLYVYIYVSGVIISVKRELILNA